MAVLQPIWAMSVKCEPKATLECLALFTAKLVPDRPKSESTDKLLVLDVHPVADVASVYRNRLTRLVTFHSRGVGAKCPREAGTGTSHLLEPQVVNPFIFVKLDFDGKVGPFRVRVRESFFEFINCGSSVLCCRFNRRILRGHSHRH